MKFLRRPLLGATLAAAALPAAFILAPAPSAVARPVSLPPPARACPPMASAVSFSDSLDKLVYNGAKLGGLSSLAYDPRSAAYVSAVDNNGTDPARIWFFRNLSDPKVIRDPLVLRKPDGTPYDGTNSDNEGLAVLPGRRLPGQLGNRAVDPHLRAQRHPEGVPAGPGPLRGDRHHAGRRRRRATPRSKASRSPATAARSSPRWRARCPATSRRAATRRCTASWSTTSTSTAPGTLAKQIAYRTDTGQPHPRGPGVRQGLAARRGGRVLRHRR